MNYVYSFPQIELSLCRYFRLDKGCHVLHANCWFRTQMSCRAPKRAKLRIFFPSSFPCVSANFPQFFCFLNFLTLTLPSRPRSLNQVIGNLIPGSQGHHLIINELQNVRGSIFVITLKFCVETWFGKIDPFVAFSRYLNNYYFEFQDFSSYWTTHILIFIKF